MTNDQEKKTSKSPRLTQLANAAAARAKITARLNGAVVPVTYADLKDACANINASIDNIVGRMVKNNLIQEVKLDPPVGRYKVGYLLAGAATELQSPTKRPYTKKVNSATIPASGGKPSVVVTATSITVDYPHMRVIIQVV